MDKKTKKMKNLVSKQDGSNLIIHPEKAEFMYLPYFRKEINLTNDKDFNGIVKSTESLIRTSKEYAIYKSHLIEDYNLRTCALYSNIDMDKAKIEMHHGPILTLFEYVTITALYFFKNKKELSTFRLFDEVLQDHFDHMVQTIMLSEMAHAAVHPKAKGVKPEFVSMDKAFGDLSKYISKYSGCFPIKIKNHIAAYMREYEIVTANPTERFTIFKESIKSWKFYSKKEAA